jgi:PBSX family phage terminase large subunit
MQSSDWKGPNPKQRELSKLLASDATHVMAFGGSSSGKTFWLCRAVAIRAMLAPGSRHAILRHRFNHLVTSVVHDTWPTMMGLCFPGVEAKLNKSLWYIEFENGSQVWFGGLDEKERTEKILGQGHTTIYLNECSQIPWSSVEIAKTRLRQKVSIEAGVPEDGSDLPLRMYYDCNPPLVTHWAHRIFIEHREPEHPYRPLFNPENYVSLRINPEDNIQNLPEETLEILKSLSPRQRQRFLDGLWGQANENALWTFESIERARVTSHPDLQRVVIGVDPSGTRGEEDERSDHVGIVVVGLGVDGQAYVLEDATIKAPPQTWGRIVCEAFDRHEADVIVGEINFGGAMVQEVVRSAAASLRLSVNFKEVHASRGKVVRAEPIATLYGHFDPQNARNCTSAKVHHVGSFPVLEDQLCAFTTMGYTGDRSPDRADALIWALSELFPGMTRKVPRRGTVNVEGASGFNPLRF